MTTWFAYDVPGAAESETLYDNVNGAFTPMFPEGTTSGVSVSGNATLGGGATENWREVVPPASPEPARLSVYPGTPCVSAWSTYRESNTAAPWKAVLLRPPASPDFRVGDPVAPD